MTVNNNTIYHSDYIRFNDPFSEFYFIFKDRVYYTHTSAKLFSFNLTSINIKRTSFKYQNEYTNINSIEQANKFIIQIKENKIFQ